jgi:hypothetical protein
MKILNNVDKDALRKLIAANGARLIIDQVSTVLFEAAQTAGKSTGRNGIDCKKLERYAIELMNLQDRLERDDSFNAAEGRYVTVKP